MNKVDIGEYNTLVNKYNDIYKENKQLKEELKYTVPIVEHNKIVDKKLKEIQMLKIQVSSREEVANKYKEVIEEVREVAQQLQLHYQQQPTMIPNVKLNKLLQILDKGESNE